MNKSVSIIILLLVITIAGFGIGYSAYISGKSDIVQQLLLSFKMAVESDKDKRLKECDASFIYHHSSNEQTDQIAIHKDSTQTIIERREGHRSLTDTEKLNHVTQTYLFEKNPVQVAVLDSFWRVEVNKLQGIYALTAISYKNSITGEIYLSHPDFSFYASADTIAQQVLGVRGEIILQGFAKITSLTVIKQSPKRFVGIISGWVLACLLFLFFAFCKKKEVVAKEEEPLVEEPKDSVPWNPTERYFVYNGTTIKLPPKVGQCFDLLWSNQDKVVPYQELVNTMFGDINLKGGKERLAQHISTIREKFKPLPIIEIEPIEGIGYKLIVHPQVYEHD